MAARYIHCPSGTPGPPGIGSGCGHFEPLDLADSRPAFDGMVRHLTGLHGGYTCTPEDADRICRRYLQVWEPFPIDEGEASCGFWDHGPHDNANGRCWGQGPFRRVPKREMWPPSYEEEE